MTNTAKNSKTCSSCGTTIITFDPPIRVEGANTPIRVEGVNKSLGVQIVEKLNEVMIPRDDYWLVTKSPEELAKIVAKIMLDVIFAEEE